MINTTQLVVKNDKTIAKYLESKGFSNANITKDYKFPVFIVDIIENKFFGTNTACMAAACSSGRRPNVLSLEQLKEKLED